MSKGDEKQRIKADFSRLHSDRATLDGRWSEIARLASPRDNMFNRTVTQGENLRNNQFDETAELTLDRATSNYNAITTPDSQRWHKLEASIKELNEIFEVRIWFEQVEDILFKLRYAPKANFSANKHEENRSLLGFGNGVLFTGEGFGVDPILWYRAVHMSEIYFSENKQHLVDKVYRRFPMTMRQVIEEYGEDNVSKDIKEKPEESTTTVLHCVKPNPDWDPESNNTDKMRYMSRHMLLEGDNDDQFLREGGFRTFPYSVSRDTTTPQESYGRGTLEKVFPAISMLNQEKRTHIKVGHNLSDKIILMRDDSSVDVRDMRPGHFVSGGLDAAGNPTVKPFDSGGDIVTNTEMMEMEKRTIREAFLLDLFVDDFEGRERVTATEVLRKSQQEGRQITPLVGRSETESLGPMIERELDILFHRGILPQMPPELVEAEGEFETVFTSPISLAQKADEAIGSVNYANRLVEASQNWPDIVDNLNQDEYAKVIHSAEGAPTSVANSRDAVAEIRESREQEQTAVAMAEAAPGVGSAILDVTKAGEIATEDGS